MKLFFARYSIRPDLKNTRSIGWHLPEELKGVVHRQTMPNRSSHFAVAPESAASPHCEEVMVRSLRSQSHIVVADARPNDYRDLSLLAGEYGWHVHFLTNGRAAIQFARPSCADLWMVNVRLPEMSGFDLLEILRERAAGTPVFVVGDHYNPEDERRACRHGAALYLCKDATRSIDCKSLLELLMTDPRVDPRSVPVVSQVDA